MSTRTNYELQLWSTMDSQPMLNVFHYHQFHSFSTLHYAQKLFFAIQVNVLPILFGCVSSDWTTTHMLAFDLDDPLGDTYTDTYIHSGTRPSGHLPKFMVWGFKKYRSTRLIHNGWFRFSGISITDLHGTIPSAFILSRLGVFASIVQSPLVEFGFAGNLSIYSKSTPTHPTRVMYPTRSVSYSRVTTQNTRKR